MKNEYEVRGDVTAIFINSKKYGRIETRISTSKLNEASKIDGYWISQFRGCNFYVYAFMFGKKIYLHRLVMDAPSGVAVDHINGDTSDNTDSNLMLCTLAENSQNKKGAMRNSKSGIRGVSWSKDANKWFVQVQVKGLPRYIDYFESIVDAEEAARKARAEMMPFSKDARNV